MEELKMAEMELILYGDGVHDDAPAIQKLLDERSACVYLPAPKVRYCIGTTLRIHSNQTLKLDPTTVIQLMPGSSCMMLKNDREDGHENIALIGGIWDMNNLNQAPNPIYTRSVNVNWTQGAYADDEYLGVAIRFFDVFRLFVSGITIKNPVTFGAQFAVIKQFTIENITFDYNHGNPYAINMDGIHLDGHCRFGKITNLQGTCYDDLLALNADDFWCGPIEDIAVDGLFAQDCHSAVRLLSAQSDVKRIHITNVFGTYYQYCIGLTRFYEKYGKRGKFDQICLSNIYAEKIPLQDFHCKPGQTFDYPIIYAESKLDIGNLQISNLHRRESQVPISTIQIMPDTTVEVLTVTHCSMGNETGAPIPMIENRGKIGKLYTVDVECKNDELLVNTGNIEKHIQG